MQDNGALTLTEMQLCARALERFFEKQKMVAAEPLQKKAETQNKGTKKGRKPAKSGNKSMIASCQQQQNEMKKQSLDDFMDDVERTFVEHLTEAGSSKSHRVLVNYRISEMLKKMSKLAEELVYVCLLHRSLHWKFIYYTVQKSPCGMEYT